MAGEEEGKVLESGLQKAFNLEKIPDGFASYTKILRAVPDHILHDGEEIAVGALKVTAVHSPGHTPGSYSFFTDTRGGRQLFCGDQVFYHGFISLLAPPFSAYGQYLQGLKKLSALNADGLFPGHLLWTLRNGHRHIEEAVWNMESGQRPELKPFS